MTSSSKTTDVLITNGWDRIAYNILRGLSNKGLKVAFGTDNYLGMGYYSKCATFKFIHHNYKKSEEAFVQDLLNVFEEFHPLVYIPSGEEVFAVSRNLDRLSSSGVKIPVSDISTLEMLNNKIHSFKISTKAGVPTPETIIPENLADIENFINNHHLPVIIKKGWSRSAEGVIIIDDKNVNHLEEIINHNKFEYRKFIVQKFVDGETYGVSLLMNKGQTRAIFTHKRLRERKLKGGPSTLRISTKHSVLEDYAQRILHSVNFYGVAMVEFKFNPETNNAWFIEVNPRFWGSVGLAINSGVNFPYLLYRMALDGDVNPVFDYKQNITAKWLLGDLVALSKNILADGIQKNGRIEFPKPDFFDDFYNDDPLPFFAWMYLLIRRKFVKLK